MTDTEREALTQRIDELCAELGRAQLNLDMWHDRAEDMRSRLSVAQAENAKLREERREYQATIDSLVDECTDHKDENAKLRELLSESLMDYKLYAEKYGLPPYISDVNEHLDARMRELGIEVTP